MEGDNDHVDSQAGVISGTGDFTIAGFVNCDGPFGSVNAIFGQGTPYTADGNGYTCHLASNGVINFRFNDGVGSQISAFGPGPLTVATWHHVAVTVDRDGDARVYRDGVSGAAVDFSSKSSALSSASFSLGRFGLAGSYANAKFFGWKAFDSVLTPELVAALSAAGLDGATGTLFDWPCQDTNETTTPDVSGSGNVGTKLNINPETFFFTDPNIPIDGI